MATIQNTKKTTNRLSKEAKEAFAEIASPIEFHPHSLESATAIADLQAYFVGLVLKHFDSPANQAKIKSLIRDLRVVQKDLNWVYSLKHENQAIKTLLTEYYNTNTKLKLEVEKLTKIINETSE
jgi:hypothetical protein